MKFDNDIAKAIDSEVAETMDDQGYDVKFLAPFEPAYYERKTGVWSCCVWATGPAGTILAMDFDTLVSRVEEFERYIEEDRLDEWKEHIYLPQRAEVVFGAGLDTNDIDNLKPYRT